MLWILIRRLKQPAPTPSPRYGAGFPFLAADTTRWPRRYRRGRAGTEFLRAPKYGGRPRLAAFGRNRDRGNRDARRPPSFRYSRQASFARPPSQPVVGQLECQETFRAHAFAG